MKIKLTHPLISCLCFATTNPNVVLKSIVNFESQDYPNKELVISYPQSDNKICELLNKVMRISDQTIIAVPRMGRTTDTIAKNDALDKCNGEYVCFWHERDINHPMRVKYQYNSMQSNGIHREASILSNIVIYDSVKEHAYKSYTSHWTKTLLCNMALLRGSYFLSDDEEDMSDFVQSLITQKYLRCIDDFAILYINVVKLDLDINQGHNNMLLTDSALLAPDITGWVRSTVNQQFELR